MSQLLAVANDSRLSSLDMQISNSFYSCRCKTTYVHWNNCVMDYLFSMSVSRDPQLLKIEQHASLPPDRILLCTVFSHVLYAFFTSKTSMRIIHRHWYQLTFFYGRSPWRHIQCIGVGSPIITVTLRHGIHKIITIIKSNPARFGSYLTL